MAEMKRKRGRPKKEQTQRVTTFKPNGPAESMQVAPNALDVINEIDLGPVILPEPEHAVQVLRVLKERGKVMTGGTFAGGLKFAMGELEAALAASRAPQPQTEETKQEI